MSLGVAANSREYEVRQVRISEMSLFFMFGVFVDVLEIIIAVESHRLQAAMKDFYALPIFE